MAKIEERNIADLIPDPTNTNKHTMRGRTLVENSIRRRGIGRGIVAAGKGTDNPVIIGGNLTQEISGSLDLNDAIFVHTSGDKLVVTVRDDIAPGSAEAIALGIEDNESAEKSYSPDLDLIAQLAAGDSAILSALRGRDEILDGMLVEMMDDLGYADLKNSVLLEKTQELKPKEMLRILISVPVDSALDAKEIIESLNSISGIEIDYGAN